MLAEQVGFSAIYLSGAGVANASFGLPDLGITTVNDVCEDIARISDATSIPLLVDADTGWGNIHQIHRAVKQMMKAGAAGIHIEDQVSDKRCGHRPGKKIVDVQEMSNRIKAAVDARVHDDFVVIARTDSFAQFGLEECIARANAFANAGADMLFPEALRTLEEFKTLSEQSPIPILANITEFGQTPLFTLEELASVNVAAALYPLSAFRAMNAAALKVFQTIRFQWVNHHTIANKPLPQTLTFQPILQCRNLGMLNLPLLSPRLKLLYLPQQCQHHHGLWHPLPL